MEDLENGGNVADTLSTFSQVCEEIRSIMGEVVASKTKNPDAKKLAKIDTTELRIQGSFHFLRLKQLNRTAQISGKQVKDLTVEAKQKLDEYNLQLQNLQYEINHLNKEITKCLEFRSRHDNVALVPLDQFYSDAPNTISKKDDTERNEHKQTLSRLDWELETRIKLAEKLKNLKSSKDEVLEEIGIKKQHLQTLAPGLQNLLKSSLPLQEALDLPIVEVRRQHELARLLPRPLFVLFLQSKAFEEACDTSMEVGIEGDAEVAEKIHHLEALQHRSLVANGDKLPGNESDSDREEQDEGDSGRRKRTSSKNKMEVEEKKVDDGVMSSHPLRVSISITAEKDGPVLKLKFSYLTKLKFVVVKCELENSHTENVVQVSPFLESDKLLRCIVPDDFGVSCPNPASLFLLASQLGLEELFLDAGRPFLWAQQLCGLDFLSEDLQTKQGSDMQLSFSNMKRVVQQLKARIRTRLNLAQQSSQFNKHNIVCSDQTRTMFPKKIHTTLANWTKLTIQEYEELAFNKAAAKLGLHCGKTPGEDHHYYVAALQRGGDVKLNVGVVVFNDYPTNPPLFTLELNWRGVRTPENDPNLMEMQLECNFNHRQKSNKNDFLSIQLLRLSAMLDVYVESDIAPPSDFPADKLFPKTAGGRARLKPFSFDAKTKLFRH